MRYNCNASEPLMCVPFCAHEPRCGLEVWKRVFATPPPPRGGGSLTLICASLSAAPRSR